MAIKVAMLGAGGKMGCRITDNMKDRPEYEMYYVEVAEQGVKNLEARGLTVTPEAEALEAAEIVVLALPDRLIGKITDQLIPKLKPGTMIVGLDPAAAYAEVMPVREDITYFVAHPCHPPLFNDDLSEEKRNDWFGGVHASQHVVCALYHGPEEEYEKGAKLSADMYGNERGPVIKTHKVSVEQMAVFEPALVETFAAAMIQSIKDLRDYAVEKYDLPEEACDAFLMGHLRTELAIVFGFAGFPFSDGALLAVQKAQERLFVDDWKEKVMSREAIKFSVAEITDSLKADPA
jgi:hypothetical protein